MAVQSANNDNIIITLGVLVVSEGSLTICWRFGLAESWVPASRVPSAFGAASTHEPFFYVIFPITILSVY